MPAYLLRTPSGLPSNTDAIGVLAVRPPPPPQSQLLGLTAAGVALSTKHCVHTAHPPPHGQLVMVG